MFSVQNAVVNEYSNLLFNKSKDPCWEKNSLFDKNCWENWIIVWQKLGIDQCLTPYTRIVVVFVVVVYLSLFLKKTMTTEK